MIIHCCQIPVSKLLIRFPLHQPEMIVLPLPLILDYARHVDLHNEGWEKCTQALDAAVQDDKAAGLFDQAAARFAVSIPPISGAKPSRDGEEL